MQYQQNKKNQSLGLTGSNLFSWQSKPLQSIGRQPSGANAPKAPQSDFYNTPGVANRAGVPKAPTIASPKEPGGAAGYGEVNRVDGQTPPGEITMGSFAPDGTYTKNQWTGVPADFVQRYEFNRWRGTKDALMMTPKQAADIYHRDYAPSGKGLDQLSPSSEREYTEWQGDTTGGWKGKMTNKPMPTPAGATQPSIQSNAAPSSSNLAAPSNSAATQGFDTLPAGQRMAYEDRLRRGVTAMSPQQAYEYAQSNPWAGVPDVYRERYEANVKNKETKMTPQEAAKYYWDKKYAADPGRHDMLIAKEDLAPAESKLAQSKQYYQDTRNLAKTGVADYTDYNMKTDIQNKRIAENNASMDAMNQHQANGGGLKHQQSSTGFGTSEQVSQSADNLNALAAHEQGKKDAYKANQDALMDKHKQTITSANAEMQQDLRLDDPVKAKTDLSKITARFQNHVRSPGGKGTSFTDFVQGMVNAREIPHGSDALKIIQKNYGTTFSPPGASVDQASIDPSVPSPEKLAEVRKFYQGAAADKAAARDKQQEAGMAVRQDQAADQAAYRSDAARLIAQGMSPQQAHQALAQDQAKKDYYAAAASAQGNSAEAMARMYQANLGFMEGKLDREDRKAQREFDRTEIKRSQDADFAARATEANNGEDPYQQGTKANREMENMKRVRDGLPPIPAPVSQRVIDKVERDGLVNDSPESILSVMREARESGATEDQQREIIGKSFGADLKNPIEAGNVLGKVLSNIRDSMIEAAKKNSGLLKNGNSAFYEAEDIGNRNYGDVINLLYKSMPKEAAEKILQEHAKEVEAARRQYSDSSVYRNSGIIWLKQQLDNMF